MSLEYSITRGVGNRRERRKTRVVSPVMGQAGCPGRELGVSARMYNGSNSLGDRAKGGRRSKCRHAGTGEGINARIHVVHSHVHRAEDRRRSNPRHSTNLLWERVDSCMLVETSIVVAFV